MKFVIGSRPGYLVPVQLFRPVGQPNAADFSAAVLKLPAARRQRLQALFEKAIGIAVAASFG